MKTAWAGLAAFGAALMACGAVRAEPGLANKVYSPYVKSGVTEVELRAGRLVGGPERGDSAAIIELEHGFSDRFSLAVLGEVEDEPGERRKLDAVAIEGVAYLGQLPRLGVDVGAYVEYEQRLHNESGVLEGKLLLARQFGPVHGLLNVIVEAPLSRREDDVEFGYAAQATIDVAPRLQAGLQAFGDLGTDKHFGGQQPHYLGPVANWEFRPGGGMGEVEFEAAYLFPLGATRRGNDGQLRFVIEFERRF